jgi:hypothetical protein
LAADRAMKTLSAQSLELASRLDDVESTALRHGRKIVAKLEERVRLLEGELCMQNIYIQGRDSSISVTQKVQIF